MLASVLESSSRVTAALALALVFAPRSAFGEGERGHGKRGQGELGQGEAAKNESPACGMTVRDAAKLTPEWIDAVHDAEAHLNARDDCADVALFVVREGAAVRLVATTPSGRRAERVVTRPSSLRAIAIGLVASIPNEAPVVKAQAGPSPLEVPPDEQSASSVPKAANRPNAPRLVAAATAGGRLGMPTRVLVMDLALRGDVMVDDWFLMAGVRYAPLGSLLRTGAPPGYSYNEVALELGAGRRFDLGAVIFDIALAPVIVIMTESADTPLDIAAGTRDELRADLLFRALFGTGRYKPAVTLDFELAPFALQSPLTADETIPTLPNWTIGLGLGLAGDLL